MGWCTENKETTKQPARHGETVKGQWHWPNKQIKKQVCDFCKIDIFGMVYKVTKCGQIMDMDDLQVDSGSQDHWSKVKDIGSKT